MSVKIYTDKNYFIIETLGDDTPDQDSKSKVVVTIVDATPGGERYVVKSPQIGEREFALAELSDKNGTPYNLITWSDFYRDNTGNFSTAPGGSGADPLVERIVVNQSNVLTTLGGTIDSTKQYFIDGSIDMSGVTVTVPSTGIFIKGYNLDLSFLTCADNSYVMFDGATAGNVFFQDITLTTSGTASQVFDLTNGSGFSAVELVRVNFNNCTAIG